MLLTPWNDRSASGSRGETTGMNDIEVRRTPNAIDVGSSAQLPQAPSVVARTGEQVALPPYARQVYLDGVATLGVTQDVRDGWEAPLLLHESHEISDLGAQHGRLGTRGTVPAERDVDGRGQSRVVGARDIQEVFCLFATRPAEGEEVVGACRHSRSRRLFGVRGVAGVGVISPFGCLQVGETDSVVGNCRPVDLALMVRHIDGILLAGAQGRAILRHPPAPQPRGSGYANDDYRPDQDRPDPLPSMLLALSAQESAAPGSVIDGSLDGTRPKTATGDRGVR